MQIHVENLGRIRQATLELKPFTVFIGPNNTNKTWLAYVVYAIFDREVFSSYVQYLFDKLEDVKHEDWGSYLLGIKKDINTKEFFEVDLSDFYNHITAMFSHYCEYIQKNKIDQFIILGDRNDILKDFKLEVLFNKDEINDYFNRFKNKEINHGMEHNPDRGYVVSKEVSSSKLNVKMDFSKRYGHNTGHIPVQVFYIIMNELFSSIFFNSINPFFIPADRNALAAHHGVMYPFFYNPTGTILPRPDSPKPPIARTDYLYLQFLNIEVFNPKIEKPEYLEINRILENQIMAGEISTNKNEGREFLFHTEETGSISIKPSSSMVRSLAGLSLYIKHGGHQFNNRFLFFDEPEMNLHPESIVKLTELLAMYVNQGNRLLVTTHSPYIIDHVNNLIAAGASENAPETIKEHFWLKRTESFLKPDDVAAYCFNTDGTVENIFNRETMLIDWDTFSEVGNQMSNIYNYL